MFRRSLAVALLAIVTLVATPTGANALEEPRVPERVATYFATGLVPRLIDLFGSAPGGKAPFDAATKIGNIHRVLSWTAAYLAGSKSGEPTQLTNTWIAPVSTADGRVAGLATVWINPANDLPELADFAPGASLVTALAAAPTGTLLIRDDPHAAWFATDGTTLTPLVSGTSGVSAPTTPSAYQHRFSFSPPGAVVPAPNPGVFIAGGLLGIVGVLLAIFVLLPDRRRRARIALASEADSTVAPRTHPAEDPARVVTGDTATRSRPAATPVPNNRDRPPAAKVAAAKAKSTVHDSPTASQAD